jgi:hypothetical protein
MAWKPRCILWRLWAWQRTQQFIGACLVAAPASYFLFCLAEGTLPGDFRSDYLDTKTGPALIDHTNIVQAIGSCHYAGAPTSWPPNWRERLGVADGDDRPPPNSRPPDWPERLGFADGDDRAPAPGVGADGPVNELTAFEHTAFWQSARIGEERKRFSSDAQRRQSRSRYNQLRILCLSAAGAFMVGMRTLALNKDHEAPFRSVMAGALLPISVFALLLPLLATAVSGVATFDNDNNLAVADIRTLAQLEQLHGRIAEDITSDPFLCPITRATRALYKVSTEAPQQDQIFPVNRESFNLCLLDRLNRTTAWEQRHERILNDATQTLAQAGDLPHTAAAPLSTPTQSNPNVCQVAFHGPAALSYQNVTSNSQ